MQLYCTSMKITESTHHLISLAVAIMCLQGARASDQNTLIERLTRTEALNIESVISTQFDRTDIADGFRVADPYTEENARVVQHWMNNTTRATEVCAIRFPDSDKSGYELRGFDSTSEASDSGFTVTHQGRCGSCSTLEDLAVYLSTPDLTTPARECALRFGINRKKRCFQERIGFTPYCAESWAYNASNTRRECMGTCISDYGFFNLIFGRYPGPNTDEDGQLRSCLQCDEEMSGSGFKYSAGRTRRNSGIESAIKRTKSEIFHVDHSAYFP